MDNRPIAQEDVAHEHVPPNTASAPPRGGGSLVAGDDYYTTGTIPDRTQLKWGPIWAGLLTALGLFVLMTLAAIAVGLQAAPGTDEGDVAMVAGIATGLIALIAFFIGGFVSSWSANLSDNGRSMLNGFLVWALFLVLLMVLAAFGAGSIFGAATNLLGDVAINAPDIDVTAEEALAGARESAWSSLLALALTAAAAALGGVVGSHEAVRRRWGRETA
jgi:hypothetical protein